MFRSSFKGISRGGNLSLWQCGAGLWETSAREQWDSLKLAAAPRVSPGRNLQNIVGNLFCRNFFCPFLKKKKKILPGIFCELNLTNLAANLLCKNRRSRSVCFILVKFHFTRARQPVPKIVSLSREASTSSLTRISSYSLIP